MRIYVIGPVSGFDDLNLPALDAARDALALVDFQVMIPHDFIPPDATWQKAMRRPIETLVKADGVACLPGWSASNGARLEVEIAQALGMPALEAADWLEPHIARKRREIVKATKLCSRCKRVIPLLLFDKSASSGDGRQLYCRDCMHGRRKTQVEKKDASVSQSEDPDALSIPVSLRYREIERNNDLACSFHDHRGSRRVARRRDDASPYALRDPHRGRHRRAALPVHVHRQRNLRRAVRKAEVTGVGSKGQARKRQRKNESARKAAGRMAVMEATRRIVEDAELGRFERLRMCTYKRGYPTELAAIRAAIGSSQTFGKAFRYYHCSHCSMWHLATATGKAEGKSSGAVRELSDAAATYLESGEQVALVEEALNSVGRAEAVAARPLGIIERDRINLFVEKYLAVYEDANAEEDQAVDGFRERCEELGFDLACCDRFCRRYPERALYEADALRAAAAEIDDPKLLGSAILLHWRHATRWVEEPLLSDGNREWFTVALRRLKELAS